MPWAVFNRPSIQLSTLKEYLRQNSRDTRVETSHPYLTAAQAIGTEVYRTLSEHPWAAEALYCALLFPERRQRARNVFQNSLQRQAARTLPDFDHLVGLLDAHLDDWLALRHLDDFQLIGFTVCFSQLPASLLAAGRLKEKFPRLPVVFGGSTCSPLIGHSLLTMFPQIDYIINGEGEKPLLSLVRHLAGEEEHTGQNIQYRGHTGQIDSRLPENEIRDLHTLPLPVYDDYLQELQNSGLSFIPTLPLEFSRGCWWNKCTFCNLNLQWCGYRFKTSGRVLQEVDQLARKYRALDFSFTDNSLPPKEAAAFFAAAADSGKGLRFFGEVRPPDKPETYSLYHAGGLRTIQVGIEAFSAGQLQRMRKGVTVMDNVAALKFAQEAGIKLDGNLILEFPGSTEEEVRETCRVLEYVVPYRPLKAAGFFLGHGSPVWRDPEKFGLKALTPHPFNRQLYPKTLLAGMEMLILSYRGDRMEQRKKWLPVRDKIRSWREFHAARNTERPPLAYRDGGEFIIIRQERPGSETLHHRLQGLSRAIYLACNIPVTKEDLLRRFSSIPERQLAAFLTDLDRKRLLFSDENLHLALAVKER